MASKLEFAYVESEVKDFAQKETGYVLPEAQKNNKLIILDDVDAIAACVAKIKAATPTTTETEDTAVETAATITGLKKFTTINAKGQATVISINGRLATKILIPKDLIAEIKPSKDASAEKETKKTVHLGYYSSVEFMKLDPAKVRLITASFAGAKRDTARWKDQFETQAAVEIADIARELMVIDALKTKDKKKFLPVYQGRYERLIAALDLQSLLNDGDCLIAYDSKDNGGKFQLTALAKVLNDQGFNVKGLA